jgi:hypothetical protein
VKRIKMQVDNHLNAPTRVNHDRRRLAEILRKSVPTVNAQGGRRWGGDGTKMGAE